MSKVLEVTIRTRGLYYEARVAGYVAQDMDAEHAARLAAKKAARDLCGDWRVTGVELSARVTLEGVAT